jgi:hypothetical protein
MATQLLLYNEALGSLGERQLASLSEPREPRRVLDSYWIDVVGFCLAQGLWRFARRTVQQDADAGLTPQFGFDYAFPYPSDWVRTQVVSTSPQLDPPLLQYRDEANYIYANATPIYHSYVSAESDYGMNIGVWPENFADYVVCRLARKACLRLTNDKDLLKEAKASEDRARRIAKANDAMNDPPGLPPVPFWARARRGAFGPGGLWFGSYAGGGTLASGPLGSD